MSALEPHSQHQRTKGTPMGWDGRRFLAENTLDFMKDGRDERLPRFLSRAVALSKGRIGQGFRLHGQRKVSGYYYWDRQTATISNPIKSDLVRDILRLLAR